MSPQNTPGALASLNGVRPVLAHFDTPRSAEDLAADIIDLWTGAEGALQSLVGNSSLTGQQLIRAARQAEVITLEQAHALLEFLAARDRANRTSYKPTQADGDAAVDGFRALESALTGAAPVKAASTSSPARPAYTPRQQRPATPPPPPAPPASPYAPPSAGGGYRQPPGYTGRRMAGPPTIELPGAFMSEGTAAGKTPQGPGGVGRGQVEHALAAAESRRGFPWLSTPVWIAIAAVIVLIVGGILVFGRGGSNEDNLTAGITAMKNGQLEGARGEFAKAVKAEPNAATPHVFLARLARNQGDLAAARAELDTALRLEPRNAAALREMGLVLFASRQYDLARRFFIRSVQANPQDRAAQGYLGCTLMRLNRVQEGTSFISKAGSGPWTSCLPPATTAAPPPPL
ncbi:MAG TPA: tetratricopeptide repeat protein [Gemmatimonadaceae bacterium]|nr:tetratricopeptide repeat protein [Gemmatimonadaceae bacterium]